MKLINKILISLMITVIIINISINLIVYGIEITKQETKEVKLIELNSSMIHDENISQITQNYIRKADVLLNDQDKLPKKPEETISKETFDNISMETWHPTNMEENLSCYIDLKTTYKISYIGYKDTYGNPSIVFSSGSPFNWQEIMTKEMNSYNTWNLIPITEVETRYLQLKILSGTDSGISEIAIYGYKTGEEETKQEPNLTNPDFGTTMDKAIGINGFIDDPLNILKVSGTIREYHNLRWTLDNELNKNKFNPSYGGKWDFDSYYKMLYDANITVMPCLQGTSKVITNLPEMTMNEKPIKEGDDPKNPISYKEHSSTMFQYAARYGKQKVDETKLLLADDQEKKSGLGYITYYENSNEPDKTWEGLNSYMSPYELAAMCSSDYDGHEGKLGDTYGIKNADPDAKLVMGGLCNPTSMPEYLDLMKLWFENNREDKKMAFDVINFHTYCKDKSPEEAGLKQTCENITNWRNINARDKEVWLTEFGWDSTTSSPINAPNNETQRDWLIRGYLIAEAYGIDRSTMYMVRDASWEGDPGKYATSGLTTQKGAWTKKPSWYGTYALKENLTGYTFDKIIKENEQIYIYKFINKENNKECYAIWSPTSDGSKIEDYEFEVGSSTKPTLIKLEDGYNDGIKSKLKIDNGKVKFEVTQTPILLTLDNVNGNYEVPTNTKINIDKENINIKLENTQDNKEEIEQKISNNFKALFDEQEVAPNAPTMNFKGTFNTGWNIEYIGKNYPVAAVIDLKEEYKISNIGIFDTNNIGNLKFYAGTPENWENTPFAEYGLNTYMSWKVLDTNIKTRYVKIVKENTAGVSEIAFYGYSNSQNKEDPNYELNNPVNIINKEKLELLISQVKSYNKEEYTTNTWENMIKYLEQSKQIINNQTIKQEQIDQAYELLLTAISNLEKKQISEPIEPKPTPDTKPDEEQNQNSNNTNNDNNLENDIINNNTNNNDNIEIKTILSNTDNTKNAKDESINKGRLPYAGKRNNNIIEILTVLCIIIILITNGNMILRNKD